MFKQNDVGKSEIIVINNKYIYLSVYAFFIFSVKGLTINECREHFKK